MYKLVNALDAFIYDEYINNHKNGDVLQLSSWAEVKKDSWEAKRFFIKKNDKIVGAFQILYRNIALGYKLGYIPRGPVIDYTDKDLVDNTFKIIELLAQKDKCIRVSFDPKIIRDENLVKYFDEKGYIHKGFNQDMREIQPRNNMIIDISGDIEDIIGKFNKKLIKIAKKFPNKEIYLEKINDLNDDRWQVFYKVMSDSAKRNKITIRSLEYFKNIKASFKKNASVNLAYLNLEEIISNIEKSIAENLKTIKVLQKKIDKLNDMRDIAKYNDEIDKLNIAIDNSKDKIQVFNKKLEGKERVYIAASLDLYTKNQTYYLYAGSNNEYGSYNAPLYIILNQIQESKKNNIVRYDLGGVSGKTEFDKDDKYSGLYIFKSSLGADMVEYIGEFDIVVRKGMNKILNSAINIKQKLAKIKNNRSNNGKN